MTDERVALIYKEFKNRQKNNGSYSLRAFARDTGQSPSSLSLILNGKRKLTQKKANKIALRLNLSASKLDVLCERTKRQQKPRKVLAEDHFELIASWQHLAVLTLVGQCKQGLSLESISKNLKIMKVTASVVVERLLKLGLLSSTSDERYIRTCLPISTTDDVASKAIRSFHKERLETSKHVLDAVDVKDREFSSLFFAMPHERLEAFKLELRALMNNLIDKYETEQDPASTIFNLNVQAFAISNYSVN